MTRPAPIIAGTLAAIVLLVRWRLARGKAA